MNFPNSEQNRAYHWKQTTPYDLDAYNKSTILNNNFGRPQPRMGIGETCCCFIVWLTPGQVRFTTIMGITKIGKRLNLASFATIIICSCSIWEKITDSQIVCEIWILYHCTVNCRGQIMYDSFIFSQETTDYSV